MMQPAVMRVVAVPAICVALLLCGCKDEEDNPAGGGGASAARSIRFVVPDLGPVTIPTGGFTNVHGVLATIDAHGAIGRTLHGQERAAAAFFDPIIQLPLYAGTVMVNGNTVDSTSLEVAPGITAVYYLLPDPTDSLSTLDSVEFDGSRHAWSVEGSIITGVPQFSSSVTSPSGTSAITTPPAGSVIPRSQPLTVTWTGSGSDSVFVVVADVQGNVVTLNAVGSSCSFTGQQLTALSPGPASVEIEVYRYVVTRVSGADYVTLSAALDARSVSLQ